MPSEPEEPQDGAEGVWVVWWFDWNRFVRSIHKTEVEAYRAAASHNDNVQFLAFGDEW